MPTIIPIRESLIKCVADNIFSYMRENQQKPLEYLTKVAMVAEVTEAEHIGEGIAIHRGTIIAIVQPNSSEEAIWRIIGTIKLRHFDPNVYTNRPEELKLFLSLVKQQF